MLMKLRFPALVLMLAALAAGQVWVSHLRVGEAQEIAKAKHEKIFVQQEVQSLKLEMASLMRPNTLRRLAREELGMRAPKPMQVVQP